MRDIGQARRGKPRAYDLAPFSQKIPEVKGKLVSIGRRLDVSDSWREFEEKQYWKYIQYKRLNAILSGFMLALVPVIGIVFLIHWLVS